MQLSEVEFLAEKENVTIEPNFSHGKVFLIGGDLGPFEAGRQLDVPLWLGLHLRQRHMCRIFPPAWMNVEELEIIKLREIESALFTQMPSEHYREMAQLLLSGSVDIPRCEEIQTLVKDIWDIRQAKLRSSVSNFLKSQERHARLNHLTQMEINIARPFLTRALDHLHTLNNNTTTVRSSASQSQS